MTKLVGIYCISHIETGKSYVGQSIDIHGRWRSHLRPSVKSMLSSAIRKYGVQAFSFRVLELCSKDQMDYRESAWIAELNTLKPNGYNLDSGGNTQKTRSPETREKIRQRAIAYSRENGRQLSTRKTKGIEILYEFEHIDGRKVRCTQWELKMFHVHDYLERGTKFDASTLVAGRCDILRGWMLASRVAELKESKPHLFRSHYQHTDGREVWANPSEMRSLYGADTNLHYLHNGKQKTCKGWSLVVDKELV